MVRSGAQLVLAAALAAAGTPAFAATCDSLLPSQPHGVRRTITPADLIRLRETGWADGDPGAPSPLALSPDGKQLAVIVRQGDAGRNMTCVGLLVIDVASGGARLLDTSEVLLRDRAPWFGLLGLASGRPLFNQPRWSSDGTGIFFLRAAEGQPEVWRIALSGGSALQVTHARDGVIHFGLADGGQSVVYSSRAGVGAAHDRLIAEGRRGWLYDNRFAPIYGTEPYVSGVPVSAFSVATDGSGSRAATAAEIEQSGVRLAEVTDALELQPTDRSWHVEQSLIRADRPFGPSRIRITFEGRQLPCSDSVCGGKVYAVVPVGRVLAVFRESEERSGDVQLLLWRPGRATRLLRSGSDVLSGCVPDSNALICMEETATRPPRIVRVELAGKSAGQSHLIYDLNPEFDRLILGPVRRLYWTDSNGIAAYGDLTLPPSQKQGERHPLIIVQYQSRGFLRGGSGNEFPIYPLAAHGFAVLALNQPRRAIAERGADAPDMNSFQAKMYEGLWQRRALLAALDAGLDAAIATGLVDPDRVGLTGMSDGAVTAAFALIQHPRYKAAAIGPGWLDPVSYSSVAGANFSDMVAHWGLPPAEGNADFWRQVSLARNVDRINVPLLVQTGDAELRIALEGYEALRRAKRPIEMIVYPDEYHNKWQPAHLLAMYEASIDWFGFWLNQVAPGDPARANRWAALAASTRTGVQPAQ